MPSSINIGFFFNKGSSVKDLSLSKAWEGEVVFQDVGNFRDIFTMTFFSEEEPNFGLEESMVAFGFVKSLVSCFKEVLILEEDFSLGLGSLCAIIFFRIIKDRLKDYGRGRRDKESECYWFWYKCKRFRSEKGKVGERVRYD